MSSFEPKVKKPGDWRTWRDKCYEYSRRANEAEERVRKLEWEPEHLWRSIWRYWFGGLEGHLLHLGHLITVSYWKGSEHRPKDRILDIYLFLGRFNITWCRAYYETMKGTKSHRHLTFKSKNSNKFYKITVETKPFKVKASTVVDSPTFELS